MTRRGNSALTNVARGYHAPPFPLRGYHAPLYSVAPSYHAARFPWHRWPGVVTRPYVLIA
jgi:hypothetical protein